MPKKSKIPQKQGSPDDFQTPPRALIPLLPYLKKEWIIWECAEGRGNITRTLRNEGYRVIGSDLKTGTDFLGSHPPMPFNCIITNPPYSLKDEFLARCYNYEKPFALLMPLTALEGSFKQCLYRQHGIELLIPNARINFETPTGQDLGSWFTTAWFTSGLHLPAQLTFCDLRNAKDLRQQVLL